MRKPTLRWFRDDAPAAPRRLIANRVQYQRLRNVGERGGRTVLCQRTEQLAGYLQRLACRTVLRDEAEHPLAADAVEKIEPTAA
jgi:hypothetical protein